MEYLTEILNTNHQKQAFKSGQEALDNYLHKQAKQDMKRKLAVCFVLATPTAHVKGFYTLSNASIPKALVTENIAKKMPKAYHHLPVTLLGRLAVDQVYKGKGLGKLLLIDALKRSYHVSITSIGSIAIVVQAIDENAVSFYQKFGFLLLPDSRKMFLPMKTIAQLFAK